MRLSNSHIVIGLGVTGLSCVRFLTQQKLPVVVMDTRENPPMLEEMQKAYPEIKCYLGSANWPVEVLENAHTLVVSPGVSVEIEPIRAAKAKGAQIIGDIELFVRHNKAPIIAITGSNGKSTVTALVGEMAKSAGKKVAVVGNIGTPVLSVDLDTDWDLIVMELSSFQLETTYHLRPQVATVLNITPDHLDRYASEAEYIQAKHRIFHEAEQIIINKQDPLSQSKDISPEAKRWFFTLEAPFPGEFGLCYEDNQYWLAYGNEYLLPANALKLRGQHNLANALSALAIGSAAGFSMPAMLQALQTFSGLPHRCEWVAEKEGITWINDSKGTNVGATVAALTGLGAHLAASQKMIVLLGGEGKGADFTPLKSWIAQYCRIAIVMGKDAMEIATVLEGVVPVIHASHMQEAVNIAAEHAKPHDIVLLSPACASLDQYQDYTHRGAVFIEAVKATLGIEHCVS